MDEFKLTMPPLFAEEQISKLNSIPVEVTKNTYTLEELWEHKDDVQTFLIPEVIPDQTVTVLIGEDGIGKTQLLTQLCLSICLGFKEFLTLPLHAQHKRCLIVATEDSRQKFTKAIVMQARKMAPNIKPKDVHVEFTEGSNFDDYDGMLGEIKSRLKLGPIDLIVIDALSDLFTMVDGEINSNSHARKILSPLQGICNSYGCSIILIHHAGKSKIYEIQKSGSIFITKDSAQGAGAITQKPRTVLALSNDKQSVSDDGKTYKNYLHVVKANLMGKEYMTNALQLNFDGHSLLHSHEATVNIEEWLLQNKPQESDANISNFLKRQAATPQFTPDYGIHDQFILQAFPEDGVSYTRAQLADKASAYYSIGENKAREMVKTLEDLKLIEVIDGTVIKFGDVPF